MENFVSVPPGSLVSAIAFVRRGGTLCVRTAWRVTLIDAKTLARFEAAGAWLLKEEGNGYRMQSGKGSVYLMPGQLEAMDCPEDLFAVAPAAP